MESLRNIFIYTLREMSKAVAESSALPLTRLLLTDKCDSM